VDQQQLLGSDRREWSWVDGGCVMLLNTNERLRGGTDSSEYYNVVEAMDFDFHNASRPC